MGLVKKSKVEMDDQKKLFVHMMQKHYSYRTKESNMMNSMTENLKSKQTPNLFLTGQMGFKDNSENCSSHSNSISDHYHSSNSSGIASSQVMLPINNMNFSANRFGIVPPFSMAQQQPGFQYLPALLTQPSQASTTASSHL